MDHQDEIDGVDLSGIVPARREAVRNRIAALDEYDRLGKRTWKDLVRLCEPLDLAPASFHRLWRSWRNVRDPRAVQGLTRSRGLRNATGDEDYVRDVVPSMPPAVSIEQDVLAVEKLANEQNVSVRSRSALRRLVREIRQRDVPLPLADAPVDLIALDIVPIELAVTTNGIVMLPLVVLIMHPRSGKVLSATLSLGYPTPVLAASTLSTWLERMTASTASIDIRHVLMPGTSDPAWNDVFRVFERHGIDRQGPNGKRLPAGQITTDALGRSVLGFEVRQRMVHRRPEDRRPLIRSARIAKPLSLAEAQAAIDERVAVGKPLPMVVDGAAAMVSELKAVFAL